MRAYLLFLIFLASCGKGPSSKGGKTTNELKPKELKDSNTTPKTSQPSTDESDSELSKPIAQDKSDTPEVVQTLSFNFTPGGDPIVLFDLSQADCPEQFQDYKWLCPFNSFVSVDTAAAVNYVAVDVIFDCPVIPGPGFISIEYGDSKVYLAKKEDSQRVVFEKSNDSGLAVAGAWSIGSSLREPCSISLESVTLL